MVDGASYAFAGHANSSAVPVALVGAYDVEESAVGRQVARLVQADLVLVAFHNHPLVLEAFPDLHVVVLLAVVHVVDPFK